MMRYASGQTARGNTLTYLRKYIISLATIGIAVVLVAQYMRLLRPAQERALQAACRGLNPSQTNPALGDLSENVPAKDFTLLDLQGNRVSLADFRGKTVIINFWASWCAVCRSEKPTLELFQQQDRQDVVVLALASDRTWAPVRRALMGFEVASADDIRKRPEVYGASNVKRLSSFGTQVFVTRVDSGRKAAKAGLTWLDQIVSANGKPVNTLKDLDAILNTDTGPLTLGLSRSGANAPLATITLPEYETLRVLLDPPADESGDLGAVAKQYGITAVPESFAIDKNGKIRHYFINRRNWDSDIIDTCLQAMIDEA